MNVLFAIPSDMGWNIEFKKMIRTSKVRTFCWTRIYNTFSREISPLPIERSGQVAEAKEEIITMQINEKRKILIILINDISIV
jgi:hypothetical protein